MCLSIWALCCPFGVLTGNFHQAGYCTLHRNFTFLNESNFCPLFFHSLIPLHLFSCGLGVLPLPAVQAVSCSDSSRPPGMVPVTFSVSARNLTSKVARNGVLFGNKYDPFPFSLAFSLSPSFCFSVSPSLVPLFCPLLSSLFSHWLSHVLFQSTGALVEMKYVCQASPGMLIFSVITRQRIQAAMGIYKSGISHHWLLKPYSAF